MSPGPRLVRLGLLLVVVLTAVLAVLDARRDGATADEPIHLAAGVLQAKYGSWSVNVELPPLAKELWGRAARAAGAVETPPLSFRSLFLTSRAQLFGAPDPPRVLFAARLVTVAFLVALLLFAARAAGEAPRASSRPRSWPGRRRSSLTATSSRPTSPPRRSSPPPSGGRSLSTSGPPRRASWRRPSRRRRRSRRSRPPSSSSRSCPSSSSRPSGSRATGA